MYVNPFEKLNRPSVISVVYNLGMAFSRTWAPSFGTAKTEEERTPGSLWLGQRASLVDQMVNHLSAMLETQVRSLGREDSLEKEMATHSSTLAWKIPWTEEPGRLQSVHGVAKSWTRLSGFTLPYL